MELESCPVFVPRFNVAPGTDVPAVGRDKDGTRKLRMLRWGLVPYWAKDPKIGYKTINARVETAAERPAFRDAFRRRRCLVPADGFYEWRPAANGKQPHYIHLPDGGVFAFAGLWERWHDADGRELRSCAVLTKPAENGIRELHDRMPVVLPPEHYAAWLDRELNDPRAVEELAKGLPGAAFEHHEVAKLVNKVDNDGPELIARV